MCLTANHARGAGTKFGPGVARQLLGKWGLKTLVRSHQCVPKGWEQIQVLSLLAVLVQKVQILALLLLLLSGPGGRWRYSVYLLYWYTSTHTDAAAAAQCGNNVSIWTVFSASDYDGVGNAGSICMMWHI